MTQCSRDSLPQPDGLKSLVSPSVHRDVPLVWWLRCFTFTQDTGLHINMHLSSKDYRKTGQITNVGFYKYLIIHWVCTWPSPFLATLNLWALPSLLTSSPITVMMITLNCPPSPLFPPPQAQSRNYWAFLLPRWVLSWPLLQLPSCCPGQSAVPQGHTPACLHFITEDQTLLTQASSLSSHQSSQSLTTRTPSILADRHAHWSPWTIHNITVHMLCTLFTWFLRIKNKRCICH